VFRRRRFQQSRAEPVDCSERKQSVQAMRGDGIIGERIMRRRLIVTVRRIYP
jgi:hypothetical protein